MPQSFMKTLLNILAALFLASGLGTVAWVHVELSSSVNGRMSSEMWHQGPDPEWYSPPKAIKSEATSQKVYEDIRDDKERFPLSRTPSPELSSNRIPRRYLYAAGWVLITAGCVMFAASRSGRRESFSNPPQPVEL
jgi:hypothetical protein